ncbi:hypothetical protein Cgig2_011732 [Carnegiea gigantea]|uniref:Uncharacterized protein n=1 Tax=Carnegiea gigantea TaxID=171969 RepID=A0A9Q1KJL5_9CARY|nr:hypothetical protein Cgig2_011732 [Carnegiea gigantea]
MIGFQRSDAKHQGQRRCLGYDEPFALSERDTLRFILSTDCRKHQRSSREAHDLKSLYSTTSAQQCTAMQYTLEDQSAEQSNNTALINAVCQEVLKALKGKSGGSGIGTFADEVPTPPPSQNMTQEITPAHQPSSDELITTSSNHEVSQTSPLRRTSRSPLCNSSREEYHLNTFGLNCPYSDSNLGNVLFTQVGKVVNERHRAECVWIFDWYFNHVRETFGLLQKRIVQNVQEVVRRGH